ncbi:hypothetical protein [Citreimonas salinaria]|uniref:hypothetical protein n=1 Tax=Citreimonas salinaria TaxID=321339 RepID=UPI000B7DA66D|nr:hypothetical protein [Citreimonas salinaria]
MWLAKFAEQRPVRDAPPAAPPREYISDGWRGTRSILDSDDVRISGSNRSATRPFSGAADIFTLTGANGRIAYEVDYHGVLGGAAPKRNGEELDRQIGGGISGHIAESDGHGGGSRPDPVRIRDMQAALFSETEVGDRPGVVDDLGASLEASIDRQTPRAK